MGWLADLARACGFESLPELAAAMREDPAWPSSDSRKPETLENKLRHLDGGTDARYWLKRAGKVWLPALASVLEQDERELLEMIEHPPDAKAAAVATLFEFRMFPNLRRVDVAVEAPFPGVPAAVVQKGGPRAERTWWVAPRGAGKTLVGRWLEAKGWVYQVSATWADALVDLPDHGKVFLELESAAEAMPDALRDRDGLRICVAASSLPEGRDAGGVDASHDEDDDRSPGLSFFDERPPREDSHADPAIERMRATGWVVVQTPPSEEWLDGLLRWVTPRVAPGGGFDPLAVGPLLDGLEPDLFRTPGDVIEFLGVVDHVGLADDDRDDARLRWVGAWMKSLIARTDSGRVVGCGELLRERGAKLLVEIVRERLARGLVEPLSSEEWADLVPQRESRPADEDLRALAEANPSDLADRLKELLRPDGRAIVRALRAIGALGDTGRGYTLSPTWVAGLVEDEAFNGLFSGGAEGIGALLLQEATCDAALERLLAEVTKGDLTRVQRCADADATSANGCAAIDGAFRAVGLALAQGCDVPAPLLRDVWRAQRPLLVRRYTNWPPIPLLAVRQRDHWHGLTSIGAWFLAAFALTRELGEDPELDVPASLNPWVDPSDEATASAQLDALERAASTVRPGEEDDDADEDALAACVFRFGERLLPVRGLLTRHSRPLDLLVPAAIVGLAAGDDLEVDDALLGELLALPCGLEPIRAAAERRGVSINAVLAWCWERWSKDPKRCPPVTWSQPDRRHEVAALWAALPATLVNEPILDALGEVRAAWPAASPAVWERWLQAWEPRRHRHDREQVFEAIPQDLVIAAIHAGKVDPWSHGVRRILWGRMPDRLLGVIDELIVQKAQPHPDVPGHAGVVGDLVWSAPDPHQSVLVERAAAWLEAPAAYPGAGEWVVRWLVHVVTDRAAAWRSAFDLVLRHRELVAG